MKKQTIIFTTIIITLIIIIISLTFYFKIIPEVSNNAYSKGYNQGKIDLIIDQTNTGNIYYINNNSIANKNINEICGVEQ